MSPKKRPLVVLAGWLGCQKRSLKRYETLFAAKGFDVLSEVAPPRMVVETCFPKTLTETLICPKGWPGRQEKNALPADQTSMQNFTWEILRQIHQRDPSYFIFYAFSNGGCFVWEQMRAILDLASSSANNSIDSSSSSTGNTGETMINDEERAALESLQTKTAGVIFDSCPAFNLAKVTHALAYCTSDERLEMAKNHGLQLFPPLLTPDQKAAADARGKLYTKALVDDPFTTPQLYLYSETDILIPPKDIDDLIAYRRQLIGEDRIFHHKFDRSRHCAHFIDNEEEYVDSVESFLQVCQTTTTSKPSQQPTNSIRSKL